MKVVTILGTRPEIIRLSRIIPGLDRACEHVLVHTGQNFEPSLGDVFFEELGLRSPDRRLEARGSTFAEQLGQILVASERVLAAERPDRLLVLGDTNSSLAALVAKRMGIPVYHVEAGNRCYDDRVPEEVNRRVVDHCSDLLMPYTERARQNLLREGVHGQLIHVVGNPIGEVIRHHDAGIAASSVLGRLGLSRHGYMLATFHRAENVDDDARLGKLVDALGRLAAEYAIPVVCSVHPRTRDRLERAGLALAPRVLHHAPFGFFDFVALERDALCVLTDSGTVQEECCLLGTPSVTARDTTERPETLECGSNMLAGVEPGSILRCVRSAVGRRGGWSAPPDYLRSNVSDTVVGLVLGHLELPRA